MYRGERMPNAKEQWTLSQGMFRVMIKDRNDLFKQRYEYESDDDMGEDLGGDADAADLDVEVDGELVEGAAAQEWTSDYLTKPNLYEINKQIFLT